jgi:hypothetical protein
MNVKKINMKKIIILDFSDNQVYIKNYIEDLWNNPEEFLSENGFDETNCQWIVVNKLILNID